MSNQSPDLEFARQLIHAGIPVINWQAGYYNPPSGWTTAVPDETVIDSWLPGDRLYVVTGRQANGAGVDIMDIDPRNGGNESLTKLVQLGIMPQPVAKVGTPSGGAHLWLPPAGVRKSHLKDLPGIDYQGGTIDSLGNHVGRGLAAIPPSVGSKHTPNGAYFWMQQVDFNALRGAVSAKQLEGIVPLLSQRSDPPRGEAAGPKIEIPKEARDAANEWEAKYIATKLKKLYALPSKKYKLGLWDETVYGVARDLVRMTNAPWTYATSASIRIKFTEACLSLQDENDPEWTLRMEDKFDRALIEVLDAVPMPSDVALLASSYSPSSITDDGNATLVVDLHQDNIRFVPNAEVEWHVWNGHMWIPDKLDVVYNLVRTVMRELPEDNKALRAHKKRSMNVGGISAAYRLAGDDRRIVVAPSEFDAQPYKINTPGGVVDLLTGELHEPSRDQYHSKVTLCAPDFTMLHPMWDKFMADTFQGEEDVMIPFMQRIFGYCLSGSVDFDFLPFFYGASGNNGKTVVVNTLLKLMKDYAGAAPRGLITATTELHPTTTAFLYGKRFVTVSELKSDAVFNEERVKELTGGDELTARYMHKDNFTWTPTHKICIVANDKPGVRSGGNSFWRRVTLVDFQHTVPDDKVILGLEDKMLAAEGPAIFAWGIQGAVDVFANGLQVPASALAATRQYADEEDHIAQFLAQECLRNDGYMASKKDVQSKYQRWCELARIQPLNDVHFGRALAKKGITVGGAGRTKYVGIKLPELKINYPTAQPQVDSSILDG